MPNLLKFHRYLGHVAMLRIFFVYAKNSGTIVVILRACSLKVDADPRRHRSCMVAIIPFNRTHGQNAIGRRRREEAVGRR